MSGGFKNFFENKSGFSLSVQLAFMLVLIHAAISWGLYLNNALVPDELIFLESAGKHFHDFNGVFSPLKFRNDYGYGALYAAIHFCFHYFPQPQITARLFYWAMLVASDLLLLAVIVRRNQHFAWIGMLFYLTLPMVWWQGKVTGPEPLAHFFVIASIFAAVFLNEKRWKLIASGVLIGLAVGVKLTSLPVIVILFAVLWDELGGMFKKNELSAYLKLWALFCVMVLVGYILANPFVLVDIAPIFSLYYLPKADAQTTYSQMIWDGWNQIWDAVPQGSLTFFSIPLSLICVVSLIGLVVKKSRLLTIAWICSILLLLILGLKTPNFFGWYFYSPILLLPLLLVPRFSETDPFWTRRLVSIGLFLTVTLSAVFNVQPIIGMVGNKLSHMHQLEAKPSISAYANSLVKLVMPDQIVDFSEFNLVVLNSDALRKSGVRTFGTDEPRKYEGYDWLWAFQIQKWVPEDKNGDLLGCKKLIGSKKVLVMVGERLIAHQDSWNVSVKDWIQTNLEGACPGWRMSFYNVHERIHYFIFENYSAAHFNKTVNLDPLFAGSTAWGRELPVGSAGVVVGPGAENKNVLSQWIVATSGQVFKIVAHATSVNKDINVGRLQVNWIGANSQFISASGKTIEVTRQDKLFETEMVAPVGAIGGYLYVAPHAPGEIVHFSEMRMLTPD